MTREERNKWSAQRAADALALETGTLSSRGWVAITIGDCGRHDKIMTLICATVDVNDGLHECYIDTMHELAIWTPGALERR